MMVAPELLSKLSSCMVCVQLSHRGLDNVLLYGRQEEAYSKPVRHKQSSEKGGGSRMFWSLDRPLNTRIRILPSC
jgi:hypothetical protein